ncbi:MAG: hypothetical protein H6609_16335 [Ignavibacteriales bacterium]|nr:hypothetical protein [Ignavibacteriales bacterium]
MDKIVDKIVGLGVPGLVLLFAMAYTGATGAAAIVAALAFLGGPLGMMGGLAVLGLIALLSRGLAEYGLEAILTAVMERFKTQGINKKSIIAKINSYPITKGLKNKIINKIG